jgi:hypothetical protein
MLDYYEMVEALKQEKFASESEIEEVQCGDLVRESDLSWPFPYKISKIQAFLQ